MQPTWFLMEAARKSQAIRAPSGKEVILPAPIRGEERGDCWLCGASTNHGHPKKKVIKPTFTDGELAKVPHSDIVCEACTWAISHRPLRNYSLFATSDGLQFPSRADAREILLNPPSSQFLLVLAKSGQKWLHFKASISPGGYPMRVLLEEDPVLVPANFEKLLEIVENLYNGGFSKTEIETGEYQSHRIQEFGIEEWEQLERKVSTVRGSRILDLALFVAQKR